ncbi:hypothetical protein G9F72_014730 [Clostridium estertheticum]|uniref:hypothetical protein n=1 Tax=Clostridium estertheticum TaxID=238834 RepID=UPI0013E957B9|nr:hypothetical protein [Clostridium estertheticum]MBZ9687584.1 hypothetical protein [Clostridium estertheticum]
MGEDKLNSDNEKRQIKKPNIQDDKQYQKKIIDDLTQQYKNIYKDSSMQQPLSEASDTSNTCDNFDIKSLTDKVVNINILRFELDRLPLDFKARAYFENDVKPLTDTLTVLSFASDNFSISAANMANTNFGHSQKIKDALDLVVEVNEIAEDLIEVLRCKVDNMLKLAKYDCKCK